MRLTEVERLELVKELVEVLAGIFDRNPFWRGMGDELRWEIEQQIAGVAKPTTPTSGST
jgi:hypothetical protein